MNITTLLLLAAGGYVLYNVFVGESGVVTTEPAPEPAPANVAPVVAVASTIPAFKARILATLAQHGEHSTTMNADQWGYFYQLAYGVPGPDPDLMNLPARGLILTLDEWIQRAQPLTVVGLSGLRLGRVNTVSMASPYEMLNIRDVN